MLIAGTQLVFCFISLVLYVFTLGIINLNIYVAIAFLSIFVAGEVVPWFWLVRVIQDRKWADWGWTIAQIAFLVPSAIWALGHFKKIDDFMIFGIAIMGWIGFRWLVEDSFLKQERVR